MTTSNPLFSEEMLGWTSKVAVSKTGLRMTIRGTVDRALVLLLCVITGALCAWEMVSAGRYFELVKWLGLFCLVSGFALSLVTYIRKQYSPFSAPLYSLLEGYLLGVISARLEFRYPGIAAQAVLLTFGTCLACLLAYRSGIVHVTSGLRRGVIIGTWGLGFLYLMPLALHVFQISLPIKLSYSWLSFAVNAVAVLLATMNLCLDFDFIESQSKRGVPKYMEWYAAFGLMATLIWLYLEILWRVSKSRDQSRATE
jgi:uncharacterized YccA/Bax inhibitor family protein